MQLKLSRSAKCVLKYLTKRRKRDNISHQIQSVCQVNLSKKIAVLRSIYIGCRVTINEAFNLQQFYAQSQETESSDGNLMDNLSQ